MLKLCIDVLVNKHWIKSQASTIIATSSAAFFSLWLHQDGYSEREIIGLLAILYSLTFLPLLATKTNYLAKIGLVLASLYLLISSIGFSSIGVGLCVFIAAVQLSRDVFYIRMMGVYGEIASRHKVDVRSVMGMTMLLGVISTLIANPLVGYLSTSDTETYFSFLAIFALFLAMLIGTEQTAKPNDVNCIDKHTSKVTKLPSSIHWLCSLSFATNTAMFFIRYFIIPLIIVRFGADLGHSDQVMIIAGVLLSLMTAIGFIFNCNPKANSYKTHMYAGLFISLVSCAAISIISIKVESFTTLKSITSFLMAYAALEIASKIWMVNFTAHLREVSASTPDPEAGYKCFAKYKVSGAATGYVVAFMAIPYFTPAAIGLCLTIFAIIYSTSNLLIVLHKQRR